MRQLICGAHDAFGFVAAIVSVAPSTFSHLGVTGLMSVVAWVVLPDEPGAGDFAGANHRFTLYATNNECIHGKKLADRYFLPAHQLLEQQ